MATIQNNTIYNIYPDHLGTPRLITNAANTAIWKWEGEPFGNTAANEDPDGNGVTFSYNLRFPGQYYDAETGRHYNYFRDYDPMTGRYIESDPIRLRGGMNTYIYVKNTPLLQIDYLGFANGPAVEAMSGPSPLEVCRHYNKQCNKYGCPYYCWAAGAICRTADINPLFKYDPSATSRSLQCVRECLVQEDSKVHQQRGCDDGCLTDKEIDDYHITCFTRCGVNTQIYRGVGILN